MKKMVVGIAVGLRYDNYINWMPKNPDLEVIKLSYQDNNLSDIERCNGIILTGGEDVHPRFYQKPEYVDRYRLNDFNEARDEFELNVLAHSQKQQLPLLGICRGLQIANVYFGGTLIPDIESFGHSDHTRTKEGVDRSHLVQVVKGSLLESITGRGPGDINSAHHQSVEKPGAGLIVNAYSSDNIIEGLERKDQEKDSFLLLVQWHPERMLDQQSVFSKNIRDRFLEKVSVVSGA